MFVSGAYTDRVSKRQRPGRADDLPRRDDVAAANRAADRSAEPTSSPDDERIEVAAFRPGFVRSAAHVAPALLVVGLVLAVPFAIMTPLGRDQVGRLGLGGFVLGWTVVVVAIVLAAVLAIGILRAVSPGVRRFGRRDAVRLAAGDAVAAGAAATGVAFLVAGGVDDVMRVLAFAFVLTTLFTWAMLVPLYRRGHDRVADERRSPL